MVKKRITKEQIINGVKFWFSNLYIIFYKKEISQELNKYLKISEDILLTKINALEDTNQMMREVDIAKENAMVLVKEIEKLPAFREEIGDYEITVDDVFICPQCDELELIDEEVYIKGVSLCRSCANDV